jgi:site-specific recombinase XerC
MTPYRKQGKRNWLITVTTRDGQYVRRTTSTRDKQTAVAIERAIDTLGARGKRDWELIDAVVANRLLPAVLYDHYLRGTLDSLRARLADVDLSVGLPRWAERITRELAAETSRKYIQEVQKLFPLAEDEDGQLLETYAPAWRSTVTPAWLKAQLADIAGSNTNRRRYAAAWISALDDLKEQGLLDTNPMRDVSLPPSNPAKELHIPWPDALQLIDLMPAGMHRALCALRHGAGVEMQAALRTRRRDIVSVEDRVVWAHGAKNDHRDRQVILAADCWGVFWDYVKRAGLLPDALLFPVRTRDHQDAQDAALYVLRLKGATYLPAKYTLHSCRHTYAVHGMEEGWDPVLIANNEGHANTSMVLTKYGKYRPTIKQLVRADQRAGGSK